MAERYINNFKSSLYDPVDGVTNPVDIQLDMLSVDFPAALDGGNWHIKIGGEILLVTAVDLLAANPVLTATRAQEGTTIAAHGVGTNVVLVLTAASLSNIVDDTIHTHFPNLADHEVVAIDIEYDGTSSGLVATDIQNAIDEVESRVDDLEAENPEAAADISYDNTGSGLAAINVQAAVDELEAEKSATGHTHTHNHDGVYDPAGTAQNLVEDHEAHDVVVFSGFYHTLQPNQTNEQMHRAGVDFQASIVVTNPGYITGLSAVTNKNRTAGSVTFTIFKNGSPTLVTTVLDTDASTWNTPNGAFGNPSYAFIPGDKLDIRYSSTADWAFVGGGQCSSEAIIEVVYEDES